MLRKIAIGVVVSAGLFIAIGLVLPRRWHVERAVLINAPSVTIHPFVADLHLWQDWSVWAKDDPQVRNSFGGPSEGVGATRSWFGPKAGHGRMEIVSEDHRVGVEIDQAIESEKVNAHMSVAYLARGSDTHVTWVDEGTLPLVLGGYFKSAVESRLGEQLQHSLENLKRKAEAVPVATPQPQLDAGTL